ncbi:hypothetical protein ACFXHA_44535 [Nocardia sp. NPDC059240]|uniref:hypothetical protein n=1 Tax=Nocardia sp. NPDC059240 TaxID=3346786 RepID=UPI0036B0CA74
MGSNGGELCLSSFDVRWSLADSAFIARSDRHPGLVARDEWSSLAALEGLIELLEQQRPHDHSVDRTAA